MPHSKDSKKNTIPSGPELYFKILPPFKKSKKKMSSQLLHDPFFLFHYFLPNFFSASQLLNQWSLLSKSFRKHILQSEHLWHTKFTQLFHSFGVAISNWKETTSWFNEEGLKEIIRNDQDQYKILVRSRNEWMTLCVSMVCHETYRVVNFGKVKMAPSLKYLRFFMQMRKIREFEERIQRHEKLDGTWKKFYIELYYRLLSRISIPLTMIENGVNLEMNASSKLPSITIDYNEHYWYWQKVEITPEPSENGITFQIRSLNVPEKGQATELITNQKFEQVMDYIERCFLKNHSRTDLTFSHFFWNCFLQRKEGDSEGFFPIKCQNNCVDVFMSSRLFFQQQVSSISKKVSIPLQQELNGSQKKQLCKHLSKFTSNEEMVKLFSTNVDEYQWNLSYNDYNNYIKLKDKLLKKYEGMKFYRDWTLERAVENCVRRYLNMIILGQPTLASITTKSDISSKCISNNL